MSSLNSFEPIESKYVLLIVAYCLVTVLGLFFFLWPAILIHNLTDWPGIAQFGAEVIWILIFCGIIDGVK